MSSSEASDSESDFQMTPLKSHPCMCSENPHLYEMYRKHPVSAPLNIRYETILNTTLYAPRQQSNGSQI